MPDSSGFLLYRKFVRQVNHWATRSCKPGQHKRLLMLPRECCDADAPGLMCGSGGNSRVNKLRQSHLAVTCWQMPHHIHPM